MKYQIGFALLLPDSVNNLIRDIELTVSDLTDNQLGLSQPPHITVKRPFQVSSRELLVHLDKMLRDFSDFYSSPSLKYGMTHDFGKTSLVLLLNDPNPVKMLHVQLLEICSKFSVMPDKFEGDNFIPHTTVAMGLNSTNIHQANEILAQSKLQGTEFTPTHLAILFFTDNHWVTYSMHALSDAK